ncbi:stereocilin [Fundulus heteroclitus]|uniref:stereocilin n=1 Tax=Fundulus heteroclitus TaxID=8078 RepID=UPI00165A77B3|nr:stereocilin [Fundulus heteroclitus]
MWSSPAVRLVCIIFGIISDASPVCSQPQLVARQSNEMPAEDSKLKEDIRKVIDEIHSLSAGNTRKLAVPFPEEPLNLNMYISILSNLNSLFQPLMREGFFDNLPKILVCLLSERQDCGLEAELTKAVSLEMGRPLLVFFSSLKSQTCTPLATDGETGSFFGSYLRMGNIVMAAFYGFQEMLINTLSNLTLSEDLTNVLRSLLDSVSVNLLDFIAMLLKTPMDYVRIALEFGIQIPSLVEQESCQQGDLKQLIMWGLKHNVSWSLGVPLVDILLETFLPPDESLCTYSGPECQSPSSILSQRSASQLNSHPYVNYKIPCDHRNLAALNDTLCADILVGSGDGSSTSVLAFCQALSSLNSSQMEHVWRNLCYVFQPLTSTLVTKSSDCVVGETKPFDSPRSLNETQLVSPPAPRRVAREASSLRQLACDYSGWLNSTADAALVSLCSVNEPMGFVRQVCNNATLMKKLLTDRRNVWLYPFCANSTADAAYMASQFCVYEQWLDRPAQQVDSALLQFCFSLDAPRLTDLICQHTGFLMLLISSPDNWQLMPNCSNSPPPFPGPDALQLESCQYSEWHDVMQITTDILSKCIVIDQSRFTSEVCGNKTFLNSLLQNKDIAWLDSHCSTSLVVLPAEPTQNFDLAAWCDYQTWGERQVDPSVVALCWQNDQAAFQENVCCQAAVFEKLLENPQNMWLTSVCTDMEQMTVTPQLCRYSDWTQPIIVDMTELALCAEIDPQNFTTKVCANKTVLNNLMANQDNAWLTQHCANHTSPVSPPVGGGGQTEFKVAERCLYSSWISAVPNATLLAQCWENDQANFVSSICPNAGLLFLLSRKSSTAWVSSMCTAYANYTSSNNNNSSTTTTAKPSVCASQTLLKQFGLMCPHYCVPDCQPCPSQNMVLQMMVRCWVESLSSRMEGLLTTPVTEGLNRAVATTVVILLLVEDSMGPIWQVNNTIRQSVLMSVVDYLKREVNQDNKRVLLQCFGTVLSRLLQATRDVTGNELLFIKEYFQLPLSSLSPVLAATHISTIRLILQYYNRFKNSLQLSEEYQSTMVSVLLKTHQPIDDKLLLELGSLLTAASPADIQALPSIQINANLREFINKNMERMSLAQREAFGLWYGKSMSPSNITGGHQSLIRDTGNLIAYLPFHGFQHFSAAQLLDGLDVLQRNILSSQKQEFIANKLIGTYRNLTAQDFIRLGNLLCLADPADLLVYRNTEAFRVIVDNVMNCTLKGLSMPSQLISEILLNNTEFAIPSSLSAERLAELAPLLPLLGVTFIKGLTTSQLLSALPALSSVPFTPIQASIIVDKLNLTNKLNPGQLQELGTLIVGVKTETLLTLTSDKLLSVLKALTQQTLTRTPSHKHILCAAEATAIATKLWGFPEVVSWLDDVEPLLRCTPLLSILPRTGLLVDQLSNTFIKPWNTQQAQAIVKELINTNPNLIKKDFLSLKTLGQGVSCNVLRERFQANKSSSSVRNILVFLRQQPGDLHTSLKRCVIKELQKFEFFTDLLQDLGAEIALSIPISTIRLFPIESMDTLRKMIVDSPRHFLMLSRKMQELLVDKIIQKMGMYTGSFTEEEFRLLGIMAPFVVDEVFVQVDRSFFIQNLESLKGLCYSTNKMEIVARILQEPAVFGPVENWNLATLTVVGRFLFFLPLKSLQEISPLLMTVGRIEKLFMSQRQWEDGDVGTLCSDMNERMALFEKQQFVLQFFLGFLKIYPSSRAPMVPSCEILHNTAPSAWTSSSFTNMPSSAFFNCLELMGNDPFLASYQRAEILKTVKKTYGPVSSFSQSVIAQLGVIATELSPDELGALRLSERSSIGSMGAVDTWNNRQLAALFTTVLNSNKLTPSQLDSSMLVALGHVVCGAQTTMIKTFNNVEFSKAVLWLGQLRLSCSEEQMLALVELLTHRLAFGHISSWGTDVFIEIGVLAAGLPDMAMSALVKEQIEGITPLAISTIPPKKFAVAVQPNQISMFSYEQAVAVTPQQISVLSDVQRRALNIVLGSSENRAVDIRGRSLGLTLTHSPQCLILVLLMLLTVLF